MIKAIPPRRTKMMLRCYGAVGDSTAFTLAFYGIAVRTQLRCDRGFTLSQRSRRTLSKITILHINLFIAYILRASVSLLRNYIFGRAFVLSLNGHLETETDYTQWVCKPITTLFVYALVASTFWLSVEAFVLTKLIVDWKYLQKRNNLRQGSAVHCRAVVGSPGCNRRRLVRSRDYCVVTCWISYTCEWSMWVFVRGPVFISIFSVPGTPLYKVTPVRRTIPWPLTLSPVRTEFALRCP
uniref:Uncharacterized protein n=1 Tax=Magallana gigas TaxID=29159 RepID=K1RRQ6_MAGGI